jgi:putative RecB family exonuclease
MLPLPRSLSPSKVSQFQSCGLKFRYEAIDGLSSPGSFATLKGTATHKALEMLFMLPPADRTQEAALGYLELAIEEARQEAERDSIEIDEGRFGSDCRSFVRKYFEMEDPTEVNAVGLELMVEVSLGKTIVRGIIDRLDQDEDGNLIVVDYKSGRVPMERFQKSSLMGVNFYAYLCREIFGRLPVEVKLLYLSKPAVISMRPTERSVNAIEKKALAIWRAVERACDRNDFRPSKGKLCDFCPFKPFCPEWGGVMLPPPSE